MFEPAELVGKAPAIGRQHDALDGFGSIGKDKLDMAPQFGAINQAAVLGERMAGGDNRNNSYLCIEFKLQAGCRRPRCAASPSSPTIRVSSTA
jgi:hypothetical protein